MLKIKHLVVGQLQTNCYLVINEKSKNCLIIDPGDDADYITRQINDENVKPVGILATHGHFDHILAVTELKIAFKIPFLMHKKDEFLLSYMRSSAKRFLGITVDPAPSIDQYLNDEDIIPITNHSTSQRLSRAGGQSLVTIYTPGHTPGSVTFYNRNNNIAFVGDLFFENGGVGRTDFSYSDPKELNDSIIKVMNLPNKTNIYCGHQKDTTVHAAKRFLKDLY